MVQRGLGEGPHPRRGAVVWADAFAAIQPWQGTVQQGWTTHLTTVRRWVPLYGPVPVVRVVALSVNIKQYIHVIWKWVLRWVHVGVSQSGVM